MNWQMTMTTKVIKQADLSVMVDLKNGGMVLARIGGKRERGGGWIRF